jgi:hypothetical protein
MASDPADSSLQQAQVRVESQGRHGVMSVTHNCIKASKIKSTLGLMSYDPGTCPTADSRTHFIPLTKTSMRSSNILQFEANTTYYFDTSMPPQLSRYTLRSKYFVVPSNLFPHGSFMLETSIGFRASSVITQRA